MGKSSSPTVTATIPARQRVEKFPTDKNTNPICFNWSGTDEQKYCTWIRPKLINKDYMNIETLLSGPISTDVELLNFGMLKLKLQDPDEGPGWTREQCDAVEVEYRRFLTLKLMYPDTDIVPHQEVDVFWHQHILDTQQYAEDCEKVFGQFLHHFPYFGMRGKEDAQNLMIAFEETKRLYEMHFGESYIDNSTKCRARCRTQCKPVKCK